MFGIRLPGVLKETGFLCKTHKFVSSILAAICTHTDIMPENFCCAYGISRVFKYFKMKVKNL